LAGAGAGMSERFLVTGAYGCIGAWVLRQLVDEGVDVVAADASTDDHRVTALLDEDERAHVRFVQSDISRPEEVEVLFDLQPTHVIHLAALQVPFCRADPVRGAQVNVVGTVAIFTSAVRGGLHTPIVYASSAAGVRGRRCGTRSIRSPCDALRRLQARERGKRHASSPPRTACRASGSGRTSSTGRAATRDSRRRRRSQCVRRRRASRSRSATAA